VLSEFRRLLPHPPTKGIMEVSEQGARILITAIIAQAAKDTRKGDESARAWLLSVGAELLSELGLCVDLGAWLADAAQVQT